MFVGLEIAWDPRVPWPRYSRSWPLGILVWEWFQIFNWSEGLIVEFSGIFEQKEQFYTKFCHLCYDASGEFPDSPHLLVVPNSNCGSCGCRQSEAIVYTITVSAISLHLSTATQVECPSLFLLDANNASSVYRGR